MTLLYSIVESPLSTAVDLSTTNHPISHASSRSLRPFKSHRFPSTPSVPNLELHSAAASGNVGLVHYALTHGQPVNSVLHGVLPLHAACSGGNVSVVRMLIERGADVNAPRLPRRYSDGRKLDVPSVGTAGSTPLHFAAANGHAPIVQILLTCGATPDKSDKNGMTPEALAEVNGHTDVIRVLRVWEHLKLQESQSHHSSAGAHTAGAYSDRGDIESLSGSTSQLGLDEDNERYSLHPSRKGKERAMSVTSNVSNASSSRSQALRIKKSFEGLLKGRRSRSASVISMISKHDEGDVSPRAEEPGPEIRLSTLSNETDPDTLTSLVDVTTPTSPRSLHDGEIPPDHPPAEGEAADHPRFERTTSGASSGSARPIIMIDESPPVKLAPPPTRRTASMSSRRPTLPSIFEKAAHPGAAFRAAMRRDHDPKSRSPPDRSPPAVDELSPKSASSSGSFFRGRVKANDGPARHAASRKYMSKQGIVQLFRRGQSPPSRSPSPPLRTEPTKIIAPEELDEGIERLKRASLDLDMRESRENSIVDMTEMREEKPRLPPASAPASKTRFFEDLDAPPVPPVNLSLYMPKGDERQPLSASSSGSDRPRTRPRTGSEVIAPSPLANEWAHDEDSDSPPRQGVRRIKTETIRGSPPLGYSNPSTPSPPMFTKPRSLTMPSTPTVAGMIARPDGLDWEHNVDLRKVASGVFRRETDVRQQEDEDGDADEGDEEFHDALPDVLEPQIGVEDALQAEDSPSAASDVKLEEISEPVQPEDAAQTQSLEQPSEVMEPSKDLEAEPVKEERVDLDRIEQRDVLRPASVRETGRYRGASIGSTTSQSSRISTAPGSSLRMSLITDETGSDRGSYDPIRSMSESRRNGPPPPPPLVMSMSNGRQRGISVSSTSTSTSGMGFSYSQSASTPSTSLTPQSTLSIHLSGGFPPVPEHEVAHHPVARRKVSSRAEAANIVKQNEDDILQLAQLPPSLDSSRSLAAQLAAYGENHAIEQEFAEREAQASKGSEVDSSEAEEASFFSADESARSAMSSPMPSDRASHLSGRKSRPPPSLLSIDAPRSSVPSINNIYDKRAAAYRQRMMALTAVPPNVAPSSSSSTRSRTRPRAATYADSWLNAGPNQLRSGETTPEPESDRHPNISGPTPMVSSSLNPSRAKKPVSVRSSTSRAQSYTSPSNQSMSRSLSPIASRALSQSRPLSPRIAPAPIADVVSTRFQGIPAPTPVQSALPPHVSIFSNRYSGLPHDGGDSDDDEHEQHNYMLIENDWRGGHVVGPDVFKKNNGKWGQFKGAIGHIGRKKGELA